MDINDCFKKVFYRSHMWADKVSISPRISSSVIPSMNTHIFWGTHIITSRMQHQDFVVDITCAKTHATATHNIWGILVVIIVAVVVAVVWLNIWKEFFVPMELACTRKFYSIKTHFEGLFGKPSSGSQMTSTKHTLTFTELYFVRCSNAYQNLLANESCSLLLCTILLKYLLASFFY